MLRFLLLRPIATTMVLITWLALGILAYFELPVSLLPNIDIPNITISTRNPNRSSEEIEQNVLRHIRESMQTMNGLRSLESVAQQGHGIVTLKMNYGVNMDLAFIEANEKIDRLISTLPRSMDRPQLVKSNTSDIPVVRIQIVPKNDDVVSASELVASTIKRRIERLDGIGVVDVSGIQTNVVRVTPNYSVMQTLGLTDSDIIRTISNANLELGSLYVIDGNYRLSLKLSSRLNDPQELGNLPIKSPHAGTIIYLKQIANVHIEQNTPSGYHLFKTDEGIVVSVHKQGDARMPEVINSIENAVAEFKKDYPSLEFRMTQNQSMLLTLSIDNLSQALVWGGIFAFAVLFLFMGGWREPLIMGIVLPLSLLLCFSLLYLFNISLNIISLSGVGLGLGMMVDNSIVVLDNIILKRKHGAPLLNSCVAGTREVVVPLVSSALTNLAVLIPLIFMSGITGALFYDQAISVTCILFVSIICTFFFVPLLYLQLNKNRTQQTSDDSRFFTWVMTKYRYSFSLAWKHKLLVLIACCAIIPISIILLVVLPKEGFPTIERKETLMLLDWNEPITLEQSRARITNFISTFDSLIVSAESEIGHQQFMLRTSDRSVQQVEIYLLFSSAVIKKRSDLLIRKFFARNFPRASVQIHNAPNAFEQLFISKEPILEARIRDLRTKRPIPINTADQLLTAKNKEAHAGKGFETESMVTIKLDFVKMELYNVDYSSIIQKLQIAFGDYVITDFKNFGKVTSVRFSGSLKDTNNILRDVTVKSAKGQYYPIGNFVKTSIERHYKNITADAAGPYQSLIFDDITEKESIMKSLSESLNNFSFSVDFRGQWFEDRENLSKLTVIFMVSLLLMYFIITAEFESFTQPLIVMLSIPIGFFGSLILLWAFGGSLNIMSGIGLVVVLGILDNDAILKIDKINSLSKTMPLENAIYEAGVSRLKPIVMNTCTNVLALTPIIFSNGLGADLQRPVAITAIGGLIMSTFAAIYFIPIVYWYVSKRKSEKHLVLTSNN